MPCPRPAVPSPVVALAGWCPLSPAGAQTPQLLVEPPWTPAVLWDRVTLTCQGSGTAGATTWYKDGRRWWQEGPDSFTVTESGTYQCQRPGTGLSPPVTVSDVPVANATITPGPPALQVTPLLEVTPQGTTGHRWNTVAAALGGSLLFLLLLVAGAVGWHRWNSMAARKQQERAPPEPPAPPEEGEVLYTHVVSTKQPRASPRATTLQDPQVTYAELAATHGRPRECGDIYMNVL
ncbi:uncharacterized protein LOC117008720 isoform X2 [Catharus ustulatus]|uniref:uncharacterized protein LOC117008720 isoform X2 n=1 Tax=Catharus ustulatus TaxID=91951 RepID=UPI001408A3D2|nr:uncharacterized protein LOC117008720 isoform X2 [Catharus ustulatus]